MVSAAEGAAVDALVGAVSTRSLGHVVEVDTDLLPSRTVVEGALLTGLLLGPERFTIGEALGMDGGVVSLNRVASARAEDAWGRPVVAGRLRRCWADVPKGVGGRTAPTLRSIARRG